MVLWSFWFCLQFVYTVWEKDLPFCLERAVRNRNRPPSPALDSPAAVASTWSGIERGLRCVWPRRRWPASSGPRWDKGRPPAPLWWPRNSRSARWGCARRTGPCCGWSRWRATRPPAARAGWRSAQSRSPTGSFRCTPTPRQKRRGKRLAHHHSDLNLIEKSDCWYFESKLEQQKRNSIHPTPKGPFKMN